MRKTIAIDFDGVIRVEKDEILLPWDHVYEGAFDFIEKMIKEGNRVIIFTARRNTISVADFLVSKDAPFGYAVVMPGTKQERVFHLIDKTNMVGITNTKYSADIYIDDRGYRFEGDWNKTIVDVLNLLAK